MVRSPFPLRWIRKRHRLPQVVMIQTRGDDRFEAGCDVIDVTSLHRPDTSWRLTDAHGHEHRWYIEAGGPDGSHIPAASYSPSLRYITPTLMWVKDGEEYWEDDDEPHDVGHLECRQCSEPIRPRYTADTTTQHISGLRWYRINGETVSPDEFKRRYEEAAK